MSSLGIANRDLATIERIAGTEITVHLEGKARRQVSFDAQVMKHFDHGYTMRSHVRQGITAGRVLINMGTLAHTELVNIRFVYVAVSQASHDARVFTDDAETLGQRMSRNVSESFAVEFEKSQHEGAPKHLLRLSLRAR